MQIWIIRGLFQSFLVFSFLILLNSCGDRNTSENPVKPSPVSLGEIPAGCGPASIEELKTTCPQIPGWLLLADTQNERVSIYTGGAIVWENGTWLDGTWENGTWLDGAWENGFWENGTWKNGFWEDGFWEDGTWENGSWLDGTWENGTWLDGFWHYGTWENGAWNGGFWSDGTWNGGFWHGEFKGSGFDPKTAN